jgi:hypothetical protein
MADGYVQPPADGAGKKVDATTRTNADNLTVYRIRVEAPDGMKVSGDLLDLIYSEMRTTNDLLAQAFGLGKDLALLRVNPGV